MQGAHELLKALTIVLGTAAVTTVLFQRLRQPVVLGYLVAGMLVGPHVPIPLQADKGMTHTLSELGVILLLFSLGLEFSLRKLFRVGAKAGFVAVVQSSLMVWLGYVIGRLSGWTVLESVYAGGIIAISSTTIIVKAFQELGIEGRFKETVFGVLIVEDLIAILLLTVLTALSSGEELSARGLALTTARLGAFLVGLLVVGLLLVPRIIRFTVKLDRPETTLVVAVGICFASALLAESFGYSVALGAFIAGSLIGESGEEKRVEHLIQPVRDMFGAIFFVSVGMLIEPRVIAQEWRTVLVLTAAVVVGKVVFVALSSFLTGAGVRGSVQAGMSLAQIGELSFIIAGLGISLGATRSFLYPVAVAVSALTTLLTPWLIRASDPVASWVDRRLPRPLQTFASLYGSWIEGMGAAPAAGQSGAALRRSVGLLLVDGLVVGAVVIGISLSASRVSMELVKRLGVSQGVARILIVVVGGVLILPFAVGAVRAARRVGFLLATQALASAPLDRPDLADAPRRALIVTLQLAIVVVLGAPLLAVTQPFIPSYPVAALLGLTLVVLGFRFWRTATNLHGHVKAAAEVVVEALARQATGEASPTASSSLDGLAGQIPGLGGPVAMRLSPDSYAVGKSLAQLDLRGLTGATVLALTRDGGAVTVPSAEEALASGDRLALAGTGEAVAAAIDLLQLGPGPRVAPV